MFTREKMYHDSILLSLHFMVSEIWSAQDFKAHGHYGKVKSQIKVTS